MIDIKKNIFILTGSGVSKESGIQTFREKDGLWDNFRIEDVCTIEAFIKNPQFVNDFYNQRKKKMNDLKVKPNPAHEKIANLENKWQGEFLLVTQNIDNLHEKAGSKKIIHMHGTLEHAYCMNCNEKYKLDFELNVDFICKRCNSKGQVRVDVVWFGEQPRGLDLIYNFLNKTDIFLSVGTSNNVYPAAGFIDYLNKTNRKAELYEFNIDKTNKSDLFTKSFIGPASETLKKFVNSI